MALDGVFLREVAFEIETLALGARIEKIHMPSSFEVILCLRAPGGNCKLLLSVRPNSARVHITSVPLENPKVPPMFCMLLRKRLGSAKLVKVQQPDLERVVFFVFDCVNELGDRVEITLVAEIMGKYSNVILIDSDGKIIDAMRRVDFELSSKRQVLPGMRYELPPAQGKYSLLSGSATEAVKIIRASDLSRGVSRAVIDNLTGLSGVVAREIEFAANQCDKGLLGAITSVRDRLLKTTRGPAYMVLDASGEPVDFSFIRPECEQKRGRVIREYESFCQLLEDFYYEKDKSERMKARARGILRVVNNAQVRLGKKIKAQTREMSEAADGERFKLYGDLISANLYRLSPGMEETSLENFYSPDNELIKINLQSGLSPAKNAQKFYKMYKKSRAKQSILSGEVQKALREIEYIDSVLDALSRADSQDELDLIRQELQDEGYIRVDKSSSRKKQEKVTRDSGHMEFLSADGVKICVGKNNRQNDKLTFKIAKKNDIWLHVKDIPGSHVVICAGGAPVPPQTLMQAASLAAFHSKARCSSNVPVDFTIVRNIKKNQGAKPGMVIYTDYKTIFANPSQDFH